MDTLYTLMPLILLIFIMYFLLIRPQKKREKQINTMRAGIKVGDSIVTIGGIYGIIVKVKDDKLVLQVGADKTKLEIARWAVSKIVTDEAAPARAKKEAPEEAEAPAKKSRPKKLEKAALSPDSSPTEKNPLEDSVEENPLTSEPSEKVSDEE